MRFLDMAVTVMAAGEIERRVPICNDKRLTE